MTASTKNNLKNAAAILAPMVLGIASLTTTPHFGVIATLSIIGVTIAMLCTVDGSPKNWKAMTAIALWRAVIFQENFDAIRYGWYVY